LTIPERDITPTALGDMPPAQAAAKLREMGEDEVAEALEAAADDSPEPTAYGLLDSLIPARARLYLTNTHVFGYLPSDQHSADFVPLTAAASTTADESLRDGRVVIRLDRLHAASYPGGGTHEVLFEFTARHHVEEGAQDARFTTTGRVREGESAAIVGYPIFVGLGVGPEGLAFACRTLNVRNDDDLSLLGVLNTGAFKAGLRLASTLQPAVAPLAELVLAVTTTVGKRRANAVVQDFRLGLDFEQTAMGARLREGTYLAVQIPPTLQLAWEWSEWVLDRARGQLVHADDHSVPIPYNFVAVSVSRYSSIS
jgi:hypothetical protein